MTGLSNSQEKNVSLRARNLRQRHVLTRGSLNLLTGLNASELFIIHEITLAEREKNAFKEEKVGVQWDAECVWSASLALRLH